MKESMFLSADDVAELTGIKTGRRIGGHLISREQLQVNWLRQAGIPFYENARGRPIIARAVIEGSNRNAPKTNSLEERWQPNALT